MRRVADRFPTEVRQENRKLFGVTPSISGAAVERPWRYLSKPRGLKGLAMAKAKGSGSPRQM